MGSQLQLHPGAPLADVSEENVDSGELAGGIEDPTGQSEQNSSLGMHVHILVGINLRVYVRGICLGSAAEYFAAHLSKLEALRHACDMRRQYSTQKTWAPPLKTNL